MHDHKVIVNSKEAASKYEVLIKHGSLRDCGTKIHSSLGRTANKAIVVSNRKVFGLYGDVISSSLAKAGLDVGVALVGDGEKFKNLETVDRLFDAFSKFGISRSDVVIALGGGVVGDIAGLAAATHLRGVPLIQIPTTLLSMIDSSVGGKVGVNTGYGKNLIGTFYHPRSVLIDPDVLKTLPKREAAAGLFEAVKQGAVSGRNLFDSTTSVINKIARQDLAKSILDQEFVSGFSGFLAQQIAFKAQIVAGDYKESPRNVGPRSRKILNFGHTFAHALEISTDYKYLKHGEAVGYGIMFAAALSKKLGFLDESVVNLLRDVVHRVGKLPSIVNIDNGRIFDAIKRDKKKTSNSLNWVLLKDLGKPIIVPHEKIGDTLVKQTIKEFTSK